EAPLAPYMLKAEGGDGYIDLSWAKTLDENTAGYLIYYGESSGEYLGTVALEGNSPIQTELQEGFRMNGLQNGKIYYFAIRAYSAVDERIIGPFSKEIWARPRENKGAFYE
ncbi:MAG TPA: fibronectin type III domain-containing protein, partial [Treponemataceae bacterium]|nr:fibronectin type III domain-containing protein [Treponemataceae bacterium]